MFGSTLEQSFEANQNTYEFAVHEAKCVSLDHLQESGVLQ
jgi:hypothetical protein